MPRNPTELASARATAPPILEEEVAHPRTRIKRSAVLAQPMPLYATDMRIAIQLFGSDAPPKVLLNWIASIPIFENHHGFPKKDKFFGNRRYWPAVERFFQQLNGMADDGSYVPDGKENLDALR